ncbi:MAG: hypothetical protein AAGC68_14110 [Verrucomicrobiota bacterium]
MTTPQSILYVEAIFAIPAILLGISHLVQPRMWRTFFIGLADRGTDGVLVRTFLFELWPAVLIVVFHQDWSFPGIFLTVYGHALLLKVILSLLVPRTGKKSLAQAEQTGNWAFIPAGIVLLVLGVLCVIPWRLFSLRRARVGHSSQTSGSVDR